MIRINLLPRERVRRKVAAPKAMVVLIAGVLVFVIVISTIYLNARNKRAEAQLSRLNQRIEELRPQVARVEELRRLIDTARRKEQLLRRLEAMRVNWDVVLEEVRTLMPTDVWLTQVELQDGGGGLTFNGFAMSYEAVARFMVNLERSEMFHSADMTVSQRQKIANRDVISFSVNTKLINERKEAVVR